MTSKVTQGHKRWHFYSKKYLFKLYQTWDECLHYKDTIFMKGHILLIWLNFFFHIHLSTEVWVKVTCHHFYAMERLRGFLTFRFSDLMTTFTYILMDNFYPCFHLWFNIFPCDCIKHILHSHNTWAYMEIY